MNKYYWKQIRGFNNTKAGIYMFRLIGPNLSKDFPTYEQLEKFCQKNNIDAQLV
jgi:hypothetical protein